VVSWFKNFFGEEKQTLAAGTVLDLITNTAGLASNPSEIDPLLDKVRTISSRMSPGQGISSADEAALFGVYLQIEQYMTTKEPIRNFAQTELRSRLSPELRQRLQAYETNKSKGGV
jgi:hypothetical protein